MDVVACVVASVVADMVSGVSACVLVITPLTAVMAIMKTRFFIKATSLVTRCNAPCSRSRYNASEFAVCVTLVATDMPGSASAVGVAVRVRMAVRATM